MRNPMTSILCGVALLGAAQMAEGALNSASAQTLVSRVRDAGNNATVRFEFPARAGVCGDGANIVTRRGNGMDDVSIMQNERSSGSTYSKGSFRSRDEILRDCEDGPVRVEIRRTDGKLSSLDVRVGGRDSGNATSLGTVSASDAVRYLMDAATSADASRKFAHNAIFAATLADAQAEAATGLIAITRKSSLMPELRKNAVFWLGQTGDARAKPRITDILQDRSENIEVRKSSIFALTLFPTSETISLLLSTARTSDAQDLRKDAVFWLGNMAGEKATAGLKSILDDDSEEIEVRKTAVFAISRQKSDVAVGTLIDVAKSSKEPELRKNAMFWLGQQHSDDPRVLKLFQDILLKN